VEDLHELSNVGLEEAEQARFAERNRFAVRHPWYAILESQRDSGPKPKVARHALPWVNVPPTFQPQRGCDSLASLSRQMRRNHVVVVPLFVQLPNVAAVPQRWAGGHNPFGIEERVNGR
jgi:hypothetical protein